MKILYLLSDLMIPCIIFFIVGTALAARKKVYEDFTSGAKEGLRTAAKILPTLIGLMTAVGVLRASGFLNMAAEQLGKLTEKAGHFGYANAMGVILAIFIGILSAVQFKLGKEK